MFLSSTFFTSLIADLAYSYTPTNQPISSEKKTGGSEGGESQLGGAVQQMRDDIPTQNKMEGGNDGGERERVMEEQRQSSHKGFLMEQNLHNLLR